MMLRLFRCRWLFNRQVGRTLFWSSLIILVAVLINLIGIQVVGDIDQWQHWLKQHTG
ncbi:hypothetical protein [Serratia sp. (in: enterobacteria)]|uniref:hypothetical protein n=1 Tax=Serratia sp. (in: enterobacteria) TaxID=616 RepID=UPI0039891E0C